MQNIIRILGIIFLIPTAILINSCEEKPTPPIITTTTVSAISYTTATSGGNATDEGGAPIISKGVCWNTSAEPTVDNSKTTESSGLGTFTSNLTQLTPNTMYYVRAYATNSAGTGYGNQVSFTTLLVEVPVLTTTAVTSITQTTAVSGGNVTDDKGGSVTGRGVCWSTSQNPTTSDSKTSDGSGVGTFTSSLIGLVGNTTYYVRAYATNSAGTEYGNQIILLTSPVNPTLLTTDGSSITGTTAISGGNITADGGATITARGVCWSTSANPTISNGKTSDGTGTGVFISSITGLTALTTYYVRAYATNSAGTAYGNEVSFTTLPATIPTVSTTSVTILTSTTATVGGIVSSDGYSLVIERGIYYGTSPGTETSGIKLGIGSGMGSFIDSLIGLTPLTTYYIRAYATNNVGTGYGAELSFTTRMLEVGDTYQGGKVAYLLQIGDPGYIAGQTHGLIAAPNDQSTGAQWGCNGTTISGANGYAIGTGNQNTIDILSGCSTVGIAARLCGDLVLNGYSDWYLPSIDELRKLYINRTAIGGFANYSYWSSSEFETMFAVWKLSFFSGTDFFTGKDDINYVRAIRSF